jgi:hypothetical protein
LLEREGELQEDPFGEGDPAFISDMKGKNQESGEEKKQRDEKKAETFQQLNHYPFSPLPVHLDP